MIVCAFGRIKARQVDTDKGPTRRQTDGTGSGVSVFGLLLLLLSQIIL